MRADRKIGIYSLALFLYSVTCVAGDTQPASSDSDAPSLTAGAFPQIPVEIRKDLETRGCRIPQSVREPNPHNVISGHFVSSRQTDWAVLCSVKHTSSILVYIGGSTNHVESHHATPDRAYLAPYGGQLTYFRAIEVVQGLRIGMYSQKEESPLLAEPYHDGIEDAYVYKVPTVLYNQNGKWLQLEPGGD